MRLSPPRRILLVDDDEALRRSLAEQLQLTEGFETAECGTAAEALRAVEDGRFDLILLDVGLPDMDGRDACRSLRRKGVSTPVVMLTGADGDADTILGLDAGANDYIVKPFRLGVLLARIRAQLRSHDASEDASFPIGPYEFRPAAKLLLAAGERKIRLTEKETAILRFLLKSPGQPVPREVLLREVWGYNPSVSTHTLETHIYRLRQKIEPAPGDTSLLVTEAGGYRLVP